ncbi:MAG TPA: flagellar basal body P-ring formation chaperone FlgA [Candidatus Binatia bacterium]|nr:flagellar basal body P-ring formation chaperone FlgA [Candidatus Binatia bacterium]
MRSSSKPLLAGLLALLASVAAAAGRLTVLPEATVAGEEIRLRDVAALDGDAEALGDVPLGPAPRAGEVRSFDGALLLAKLRHAGLDPQAVTYDIPVVFRVRRAAQEVPEAAVRAAIEAFVAERLGAGATDTVLRTVEFPGPIRIPVGRFTTRVSAPAGTELLGRVRLELEFVMDDHPAGAVWVTADLARYGPVVLVRRSLARGEVITADDVEVDRRDLSQAPRDAFTAAGDALGLVVRTPLLPYAPLRREQVVTPATVRRGDAVLLVLDRGGLRITVPGEVRDDAVRGERVHVTNPSSSKELTGRVVDARTVAVDF